MYKTINVNIYFDALDNKSVSLSIVLVSTEDKKYYYAPLNILNSVTMTEYLPKIPHRILEKILIDNHLDEFYESMEKHLLEVAPHISCYYEDKYFINTIKYGKVQKKGLALVRTADPMKRKELTLILKQQGIELL